MELNAEFITRTKQLFGEARFDTFVSALSLAPVVSVRYNREKITVPESIDAVPWATDAAYLAERPLFTGDPLFHSGCYYVQEASSMFLEQAIRQYVDGPVRALDLCAAPGGKTTHLLSLLPKGSLLVSNEPMPLRAQVLAENVIKWGNPAAVVTRNMPAEFSQLRNFFDVIVVDAPCSGEGMFRKDDFAVQQWSVGNVMQCAARQREILQDVWEALRPGGLLVYSTCTFNREEDEDCVAWIAEELGAEVLPIETELQWGITGNLTETGHPVYRFIPGYTKGEGFFMSLLRKEGDSAAQQQRVAKLPICPAKSRALVEGWVKDSATYDFLLQENNIIAVPKEHSAAVTALQSRLRVLHAALPVAQIKNNKVLPFHALAMSTALNTEAFNRVELSREQALAYLHRDSLSLPEAPIGLLLLTYAGTPIGFVKNVGNRANNMYPTEWRIRKNPMEL
ncbi:MAG: rRNA cytosine-C5-methyltransferase [Bacteroidaceae bacterium]|nr:rRNA cytosine-C5-methyltransferase [Bacteroidaceae bacterium]